MLVCVFSFRVTPLSISHLPIIHFVCLSLSRDRTYIDRSSFMSVWVLSISKSHLYRLTIFLSFILFVWSFFWDHTYFDRPFSYQFVLSLSRDRTYIDRSFSVSVWVFQDRTYIDRSFSMSVWVFRDRTYIDRSFYVSICVFNTTPISIGHFQFQFVFSGPHLYRSVIILSVWVSGPHLYRSAIFLSVCVQLESGPYLYRSVIHRFVSLCFEFFKVAPISIGHSFFLLVQFDVQGLCSIWHSESHLQFWRSEPLCILIQAFFSHHYSSILGVQSHSLHLVTWCLLFVYHALLDFPFHYTWHSPLSSRHVFRSHYWAPCT